MSSQADLCGFTPGLRMRLEVGDHVIKTADSVEEVKQALRLRYEVYYGEYLGRTDPDTIDLDRFDPICDHVLVIEKSTGNVVGTYRLISSSDRDYYSCQEFDISSILCLEGKKLEIGRACIARASRDGTVFMMLWKGISEYMQRAGTRYAFGCTSMPAGRDYRRVTALFRYLRHKHYSSGERRVFPVNPLPACVTSIADAPGNEIINQATISRLLPLLCVYLHAGAVVCGEPSYEEVFRTHDFFTLLDTEALTDAGFRLFRTPDHGLFDNVRKFMRE